MSGTTNVQQEEQPYERLQHSMLIESNAGSRMEDAFADDDHIFLSGASVGGALLVYVNDSPLRLHCRGSTVFHIYDFLVPGKNTVRIEGKHSERMFIKILTVNPKVFKRTFEIEKVLAKTWLDPANESVTLEFDAEVAKAPDYEELSEDPQLIQQQRQEVRRLIDQRVACYDNHDGAALAKSWVPELKSPPPYLRNTGAAEQSESPLIGLVNGRRHHLATRTDDVQIVFGKRSVFLYTAVTSDPLAPLAYLFELKAIDGTESVFVAPTTLARIEGKWVVVR